MGHAKPSGEIKDWRNDTHLQVNLSFGIVSCKRIHETLITVFTMITQLSTQLREHLLQTPHFL